jgi:hypothetical protein
MPAVPIPHQFELWRLGLFREPGGSQAVAGSRPQWRSIREAELRFDAESLSIVRTGSSVEDRSR